MDWAGIVLERITGQNLGDYFAEHIFKPLGIDTSAVTMFPSQEAQQNLATNHQRDPETGKLQETDHFLGNSLKQSTKEQQDKYLQSGGAGLFAKPKEYVKILAALLNEGTSAQTGKSILKKETVETLWENQIPNQYVLFPLPPTQPLHLTHPQTRLRPRGPTPREPEARQPRARILPAARQPAARLDVRGVPDYRSGPVWSRRQHALVDGADQLVLVGGPREGRCGLPCRSGECNSW